MTAFLSKAIHGTFTFLENSLQWPNLCYPRLSCFNHLYVSLSPLTLQRQFFDDLIIFFQVYLACFLISSTFTFHRSLFNHRIFVIQGRRIWQRCPPRQIHQDNIVEHETSGKQPQKYGKEISFTVEKELKQRFFWVASPKFGGYNLLVKKWKWKNLCETCLELTVTLVATKLQESSALLRIRYPWWHNFKTKTKWRTKAYVKNWIWTDVKIFF